MIHPAHLAGEATGRSAAPEAVWAVLCRGFGQRYGCGRMHGIQAVTVRRRWQRLQTAPPALTQSSVVEGRVRLDVDAAGEERGQWR